MPTNDQTERTPVVSTLIFVLVCVGIVLLVWNAPPIYDRIYGTVKDGGDKFTALGAFFAALAFVALTYSAWLQRRELALQRQELAMTRQELAGQKEQMETQNATTNAQRFENTFFQLLRVHQDIVGALRIHIAAISTPSPFLNRGALDLVGRECFADLYDELKGNYHRADIVGAVGTFQRTEGAYQMFFATNEASVGHYFRTLYHIVRFVKDSDIADKRRYTKFIRAQLSSSELILLFYNCVSRYGREKFKPLVEEFALLKNMPFDLLLHPNDRSLYDDTAFGGPGISG